MMKNLPIRTLALTAGLLFSFVAESVHAAPGDTVAIITHLSGVLSVKRADGSVKVLSLKSAVQEGDVLSTEKDAFARIKFVDDAEVVMRPGSVLKVSEYTYRPNDPKAGKTNIDLVKGGMRAVTGLVGKSNRDAVSYGTPTATIGIRGTHFGALFCQNDCNDVPTVNGQTPPNGLHVDVVAGQIVVSNSSGSNNFNAGQFGYVPSLQQPPVIVPPNEAVQVRMPPSISQNSPPSGSVSNKVSDPECVVQ